MAAKGQRKCFHCKQFFKPDARNRTRQRYCAAAECRRASKADSQSRWLRQPKNRDYFKGPVHVERVRRWRKKQRNKMPEPPQCGAMLQDTLIPQPIEINNENTKSVEPLLQDLLIGQQTFLLGLLANLCGSVLQDDIEALKAKLLRLGSQIEAKGVHFHAQNRFET